MSKHDFKRDGNVCLSYTGCFGFIAREEENGMEGKGKEREWRGKKMVTNQSNLLLRWWTEDTDDDGVITLERLQSDVLQWLRKEREKRETSGKVENQ